MGVLRLQSLYNSFLLTLVHELFHLLQSTFPRKNKMKTYERVIKTFEQSFFHVNVSQKMTFLLSLAESFTYDGVIKAT